MSDITKVYISYDPGGIDYTVKIYKPKSPVRTFNNTPISECLKMVGIPVYVTISPEPPEGYVFVGNVDKSNVCSIVKKYPKFKFGDVAFSIDKNPEIVNGYSAMFIPIEALTFYKGV